MSPGAQKTLALWFRLRELDADAADAVMDQLAEKLEAENRAQAERQQQRPQLRIVIDNT